MMAVRVRMFAALREAAGEGETVLEAGPLPRLLDELRVRYGERFGTRLELCSVLVDGSPVSRTADVAVPDGAEVALLPPVSGGSGRVQSKRRAVAMPGVRRLVPPFALLAIAVAALAAGTRAFAVVVTLGAAWVLLDLGELLAKAAARPVMLAAAAPGLGLPVAVAVAPEAGLALLPAAVAAMVIAAFGIVLRFRSRPVARLGATGVAGLLVGLGASGLVLLRAMPSGVRWMVGLVLLVVVADAAGAALRRWAVVPSVWLEFGVPLVAVVVAAVGVWQLVDPPFQLVTAMRFGLVALVASVCGTRLELSLGDEAGIRLAAPSPARAPRLGQGRVLAMLDGLLLAAPAAYLLARMVAY